MDHQLCKTLGIKSEAKRDEKLQALCQGQVRINGYKKHNCIEESLWKHLIARDNLDQTIIEHPELDIRAKVAAAMSVRALPLLRELVHKLEGYWFSGKSLLSRF
jgi:hypothetical protein